MVVFIYLLETKYSLHNFFYSLMAITFEKKLFSFVVIHQLFDKISHMSSLSNNQVPNYDIQFQNQYC